MAESAVRDIHAVLREHWGYSSFRPRQEEIIRSALAGRDTLALLPTGGGKSLCFQVPALAMGKLCLVVSPLIALMKDQVARLHAQGIAARAITSGMAQAEIENAIESAAYGKLAFLYVSPERLGTELFKARLPRLPLGLIAVDEAHCISQWGYDFRPAYLKVQELREVVPDVPILALTASATSTVAADIMAKLGFRDPHIVRGGFARPELALWVSRGEDKQGRLLRIMKKLPGTAIVYVRERKSTVRIARALEQNGISAAAYHAGLPGEERDRIQKAWTEGTVRCVVATNAFGMGIDKADVRVVVHMDLPPDLESYYQEAGRGGRDGLSAYAFLLTAPGDIDKLNERVQTSFPPLADVRRVYQAFADTHRIALGAGFMETYEVDLHGLAKRAALQPVIVAHALKALELDGRIALSDGVRTPSRVFIIAAPQVVYHMRVNDRRMGPLIEALLRLYGGLYEEPAIIDELKIARLCEWSVDTVGTRLRELDKQRVLIYKPRSDAPTLTLLQQRADAQRLTLDPAALKLRKERALARMEAMIAYTEGNTRCRSTTLLAYFDEPEGAPCGQCDVCRQEAPSVSASTTDGNMVGDPAVPYQVDLEKARWEQDRGGKDSA
jgi:ATP-dependent DNA helicase RecQ